MKETEPNFGRALTNIRRTLANLAAAADKQLDYLKSVGDNAECVDELALEFHDDLLYLKQFIKQGRLSQEAAQAVSTVDDLLDRMSGEQNARLWTTDALVSASEWAEVRKLAADALALLERK